MDQNSVVIVTGASAGIGKAAAAELAKTNAQIVMLCRDRTRGEQALREVRAQSGSSNLTLMLCDLGSQKSIEAFCLAFRKKYSRLDVLINNAGVAMFKRRVTADGYEAHFGVNHLGAFLLTNRLLDLLIASAPSRIVNVSSNTHANGRIFFDDVNLTNNYRPWRAYEQSKLANIMFTYSLAEQLAGTGVVANCLHPGAVATSIGVNRSTHFAKIIRRIIKPFFLTAEKGAQTVVYLAASPEIQGITGKYFYRKQPVPSSKLSYDKAAAKRLWDLSEQMTQTSVSD